MRSATARASRTSPRWLTITPAGSCGPRPAGTAARYPRSSTHSAKNAATDRIGVDPTWRPGCRGRSPRESATRSGAWTRSFSPYSPPQRVARFGTRRPAKATSSSPGSRRALGPRSGRPEEPHRPLISEVRHDPADERPPTPGLPAGGAACDRPISSRRNGEPFARRLAGGASLSAAVVRDARRDDY